MTRICEKFIEEITSGSGAISEELKQHLASCSACREAFSSLSVLKTARKPLSAKEATAIAGILKAVQTGAAASTGTTEAGVGVAAASASSLLKPLVIALCVLSLAGALLLQSGTPQTTPKLPESANNGITTAIEEHGSAPITVDETTPAVDNDSSATSNLAATKVASSTSAETQVDVDHGQAGLVPVSPDEENIEPR